MLRVFYELVEHAFSFNFKLHRGLVRTFNIAIHEWNVVCGALLEW